VGDSMKLLHVLLRLLHFLFPSKDQGWSELEDENELWRSAFLKDKSEPDLPWQEDFSQ